MTSIDLNSLVRNEALIHINANLFGEVHKSVVRATLPYCRVKVTFSLVSMKVVINLFFTQFLDKGLHNGYRLAINIRNAASSPKKNE
jgi:hypothetical protein